MYSCNSYVQDSTDTPLPISRIDILVDTYPTPSVQPDSLQPGLNIYISLMGLDPAVMDSSLSVLHSSDVTRVFGKDIQQRFDSADSLAIPMGRVKERLEAILPDCNIAKVYGIASPYMQSVIISDSLVFIALNHYLGSDYEGYASMPDFLRRFKTASSIPADVAEAVVKVAYPYKPTDGTLIERMLYEGAVAAVVAGAIGDEKKAFGYNDSEMDIVNLKLGDLWRALASERMLYSTSHADISRMIDPAPYVKVGSVELPQKAGRIIGKIIIDSYMKKHTSTGYEDLLNPSFYGRAQQRIIESGVSFQ